MSNKTLWVVNYDNLSWFVNIAKSVGATGVAIRTDNDVSAAIKAFHKEKIKVYGWRWPSANRDPAMKEAAKAVNLFSLGMDGYFVDPEGEKGKPYDWDQPGLAQLADDFCRTITKAAGGRPFGVTSHYLGKRVFPKLPWSTFFSYATVLLPQAYWRVTGGVIGHGIPADNYTRSITEWGKTGGAPASIVPMAGELAYVTAAEIMSYAAAASAAGINDLHFYTALPSVRPAVWNAVKMC